MNSLIRGVYAITPERSEIWTPDAITACVSSALEGGVRLLQCRQKNWQPEEFSEFVQELSVLCEKFDAALILNDVSSREFGKFDGIPVAGVHLGKTDEPVAQARRGLGKNLVVGASCYNRFDLAEQAVQAGASYVAFGAVYPSSTKPDAVRADLSLFAQARGLGVPTVAIGGITLARVPELMNAGASAVAVVNGLFGAEPDTVQVLHAAQSWVDAVEQYGESK